MKGKRAGYLNATRLSTVDCIYLGVDSGKFSTFVDVRRSRAVLSKCQGSATPHFAHHSSCRRTVSTRFKLTTGSLSHIQSTFRPIKFSVRLAGRTVTAREIARTRTEFARLHFRPVRRLPDTVNPRTSAALFPAKTNLRLERDRERKGQWGSAGFAFV